METVLLLALAACTAAPAATPPSAVSPVHVMLKSTVTDMVIGQPVRATVLQDGVVMFRDVSYFELVLPAEWLLPGG